MLGSSHLSSVMRSTLSIVACLGFILPSESLSAEKPLLVGDDLLDPDQLLNVQITLPQADWNALRRQSRNAGAVFSGLPVEKPYTYFKADLKIGDTEIKSVGIRKKGFIGSQDTERPSIKVKFDEFVDQKPVKGLSRLTLNNNKQDQSQLSQLLSYHVFRKAGIHAPRSNFARVTVNGTDLGIYSNVESIKKPFLKRAFGKSGGNLYEGTLTDFHPKALDRIEVKTNKKDNDLKDVRNLSELLAKDELSVDQLEELIDLDNFLRFWAMESLLGFWDGYSANQNNYYLYFSPKNDKGYFIPWGADWLFTTRSPFSFGRQQNETSVVYAQSILTNRLFRTEGMADRYRETMNQLLKEVWDEKELLALLEKGAELTKDHLHQNQSGTAQAVEGVRDFINGRRKAITDALENWPAEVPNEPRKPSYTVPVGLCKVSFASEWADNAPRNPTEAGKATLSLELDGRDIALEQEGASASNTPRSRFGRGFGGPGGGGEGAPRQVNLVFAGVRDDNQERVTLTLTLDRNKFVAGDDPITVSGRFTQGQGGGGFGFGRGGGPNRSILGTLKLAKAGTEAGDGIEGVADLKIVEVRGGFFGRRGGSRRGGGDRRPPQQPSSASSSSPLLRTLDKDGNGTLSKEEIENAAEQLRSLDRNKDGELSREELNSQSRRVPAPPRRN